MLAEGNIQLSSLQELERLVPADMLCVAISDAMAASSGSLDTVGERGG